MPIVEGNIQVVRKNNAGFQLDNGDWYGFPYGKTSADPGYECQRGDRVKIQFTQKGKWNNIDEGKFKVLSEGPAPTAAAAARPSNPNASAVRWHLYEDAAFQQETGQRIARSTALAQAVAYHGSAEATPESVLQTAGKFAAFLVGGETTTVEAEAPTAPVGDDPDF